MSGLSGYPDWQYLLWEYLSIYRRGSAGGSRVIRQHLRLVREALGRVSAEDPEVHPRQPVIKPVVAHLGRALDNSAAGPLAGLGRALARVAPELTWEYGYPRVPPHLARRFAYAELLGPRGPVVCPELILGVVLFAPGCIYPQHAHPGISESYVSLSGAWSENDGAVYAPGSLILNQPGQRHRITVGNHDPCLLAYAWIGAPERLSEPAMRFSAGSRPAAD